MRLAILWMNATSGLSDMIVLEISVVTLKGYAPTPGVSNSYYGCERSDLLKQKKLWCTEKRFVGHGFKPCRNAIVQNGFSRWPSPRAPHPHKKRALRVRSLLLQYPRAAFRRFADKKSHLGMRRFHVRLDAMLAQPFACGRADRRNDDARKREPHRVFPLHLRRDFQKMIRLRR